MPQLGTLKKEESFLLIQKQPLVSIGEQLRLRTNEKQDETEVLFRKIWAE